MSKHTVKYEYTIKPSNIESEVPGNQKLREPPNGDGTENNNSNDGEEKGDHFVPVLTIRKEETALTKGDFKLQKVLVTENVAEEDNSNTAEIIKPPYSEVKSMVIPEPPPIRDCPKDTKIDNDREEKKHKTKIPTLKFKQKVEKVQRERKNSSEGINKIKHRTQVRRSSIPKLRKKSNSSSISEDSNKINDNVEHSLVTNKEEKNTDKPDEEFEKLFGEIINEKQVEAVAEKLLPENIEDPDKLETSFEEIIHAYNDNKIQPVGNNKSKIPLSKQKSLHDYSIPKQVGRRLSLKNITLDDEHKQNVSQFTKEKISDDVSKIPLVKTDEHKSTVPTAEKTINKENNNAILKADNNLINKVCDKIRNDKGVFLPNENNEIREQQSSENFNKDIKLDKEVKKTVKDARIELHSNTDTPENIRLIQPDDTSKISLENSNSNLPNSSKMVMNLLPAYENNKDVDDNKHLQPWNEYNKKNKEKDTVTEVLRNNKSENVGDNSNESNKINTNDLNDNDSTDNTKKNLKDSKSKRSILSKIAIFQGKKTPANKQNEKNTIEEKEHHISVNNSHSKENNNGLKESLELRNEEAIQITYESKTLQETPNNASFKSDPVETNGKKEDTATTSSYKEDNRKDLKTNYYKEDIDEKYVDTEEISNQKSEVNDIISKIDSNDKTKLILKKEIEIDIPKKRSVSSKIAMFERQSSKEPIKVKEDLPENKVKVHTIKEINISDVELRKPKIIDNVLKIQPLRKSYIEDDVSDPYITRTDSEITDLYKTTHSRNENQELRPIKTSALKTLQATEFTEPPNLEETAKSDYDFKQSASTINCSKIDNLDKKSQDSIIRSKSAIELDLGDTVIGKVHRMVVRMNSLEKIEVEKREIISVKERPRKRSVSEKIALFEKKLTPVKLENTETTPDTPTPRNDAKKNNYLPKALSDDEYAKKIEELEEAREVYGQIEKMPYVTLRNGTKMPVLAVGTALLDPRLIQPIIKAAIDLGYRAIDSAFIYGNEKEVGDAIRAKIDDGTVTRGELFIVNKLWNSFHRQDLVEKACNASLTAMGLDYFDLYLVHSPISFKEGREPVPKIANVLQYSDHDYMDAWYGMEDLVSKGLVRSIGVSNFNAFQVARIDEKARIKPVVNQVECHPYLSQRQLAQSCADRGIKLSCFGILGSKGTPDELKANLFPVIEEPLLVVMAAGLNVTAAQLLIRYQIDSGHLAVVKASSAAHLWNNLKALDFQLTPTQLDALYALNRNKRTYTFKGMGDTHRNYPFKATF